MKKYFFFFVQLMIVLSCSTKRTDDISIRLQLDYPFYPGDQFIIHTSSDSSYFEYNKLCNEIDSNYVAGLDKKSTYWKSIKRSSYPHFFTIKIRQTDSLHLSETVFEKDTITNQLVIKEVSKTKWVLIDSMTVSEVMYSYRKKLSNNDLEKAIELIERLKTDQAKDTSSCLDGTTTILEYKRNGVVYSYEDKCDYSDNESLDALVNLCMELK